MQPALVSLLLVAIGILTVRAVTRERKDFADFKRLTETADRQKVYRKWLIEGFLTLGGLAAAVLLAVFPFVHPALQDARGWGPVAWAVSALAAAPWIVPTTLAIVVLLLVVPVILLRNHADDIPIVGDIAALLPRTRGELPYTAALAINAGLVEELLFRFGMPALLFGIFGNGVAAFALAALVFGLLHLYQGPIGVIAATVLGLLFTLVYLLTGSILVVVALHALVDLRSLVLIPVVVQRVHTKLIPDAAAAPAPAPAPIVEKADRGKD